MNATKSLSQATSSTSPSPKAMLALSQAFAKVGAARQIPQFQEAAQNLHVKAQEASFSQTKIGDARRPKTAMGPAPTPKKA